MCSLINEHIAAYDAMDEPRMLRTLRLQVSLRSIAGDWVTGQAGGVDGFARLAKDSLPRFRSRQRLVTAHAPQDHRAMMEATSGAVLAQDLDQALPAGTTLASAGRAAIGLEDSLIRRLNDVS